MTFFTRSGATRAVWRRRLPLSALLASAFLLASQTALPPMVVLAQANQPWKANAANAAVHDHWMADGDGGLGRLRLGEVILPASHDSGTYGFLSQNSAGPDGSQYTTNQDIDVYTQLQHGIRVLDLRGKQRTVNGADDYYVYHGNDTTDLPLGTVLDDIARWVAEPGHDKEIIIVQVNAKRADLPTQFDTMCSRFKQNLESLTLTTGTFDTAVDISAKDHAAAVAANAATVPPVLQFADKGNADLAQYTVDEVWRLPGKQRVIVNWDDCGPSWPAGTWNGYWANQCYAGEYSLAAKVAYGANPLNQFAKIPDLATFARPGIIGAISTALDGRLTADGGDGQFGGKGAIATKATAFVPGQSGRQVPVGFYTLGTHASITPECGYFLSWFLIEQAVSLATLKGWFDTGQNHARDYLNIVSGDLVEQTDLVADAIQMNQPKD